MRTPVLLIIVLPVLAIVCVPITGSSCDVEQTGSEGARKPIPLQSEIPSVQDLAPSTQAKIRPFLADLAKTEVLGYGPTGKGEGSVPYFVMYVSQPEAGPFEQPWQAQLEPEQMRGVILRMARSGYFALPAGANGDIIHYRYRICSRERQFERYCTRVQFEAILEEIANCDSLHKAVLKGDIAAVRSRLEAGENPNKKAAFRYPFLSPAKKIGGGRFGIGTNSRYWNKGDMPLHVAVRSNRDGSHRHIVEYLIQQGADVKLAPALVMYCVASNKMDCLDLLIAAGADVDLGRESGKVTPLHRAAHFGQREALEKLIEAGADIDAKNSDGDTPLLAALKKKQYDCAKLLISAGVQVNVWDNQGRSVLDLARDNKSVVEMLIAKGVDPNAESPREKLRRQWAEAKAVRERIRAMKAEHRDVGDYRQTLKEMLSNFTDHPAESVILLALGESYEDSYVTAVSYYTRAAECAIPSNPWGFAQQRAWRELAALHESQGKYREAVEALSKWQIKEPCGTGAATSKVHKVFKIWRWRLNYDKKKKVYADMWEALLWGDLGYEWGGSVEDLALHIKSIYGKDAGRLKADMKRMRRKTKELGRIDSPGRYKAERFTKILEELKSQLDFIKSVEKASPKELVEQLHTANKRSYTQLHGKLNRLFGRKERRLWRERLLAKAAFRQGGKVLPKLLASVESKRYNPLVLYVIGNIGGKESVEYLGSKASSTTNMWELCDYFYCLLLTGDETAEAMVKDAAESTRHYNVPTSAKWALKNLRDRTTR